jgi:DMSO/TMAO reductase YedYZ molybdopterin-dependent catalytic subunit
VSQMLPRRKLIKTGLATAAGVCGLGVAAVLAERYGLFPPDDGGIFGVGETMTYAAQRILMSHHSLAREFNRSEISRVAPVNGKPPENETYQRLLAGGFQDWHLTVDGLVERPAVFSLAELQRFPSRTQITHQACEEGWSFIAEWTGVQLSTVLNFVGVQPEAKYVVYFSLDDSWWDSLDMPDALHPQTLLAYGMNGRELPTDHGAPVRMRVARQLGFKSVKHLRQITVTDTLKNVRDGLGSSGPAIGYSWYGGI